MVAVLVIKKQEIAQVLIVVPTWEGLLRQEVNVMMWWGNSISPVLKATRK